MLIIIITMMIITIVVIIIVIVIFQLFQTHLIEEQRQNLIVEGYRVDQ